MEEMQLSMWFRRLSTCQIPFENTAIIEPVELACVYNNITKEHMYCPYLAQVNTPQGPTMLTFIDPTCVDSCDFAYTAPAHWVLKIHDVEIKYLDDYYTFQGENIINYITVYMNKVMSYADDFVLFHNKISEDGPNSTIDQLTCIYEYIFNMIDSFGVTTFDEQSAIAMQIMNSFDEYFAVPKQVELTFMTIDRVRMNHLNKKALELEDFDTETWGFIEEII